MDKLEQLLPWKQLEAPIAWYYAQGNKGRPSHPLSSMRRFAGICLDKVPDETTILNLRHLLERPKLSNKIFQKANKHLDRRGLMLREGNIIDVAIISAPSSTNNQAGERDPEMHQTKKCNEWHFGTKIHICVDQSKGLIHSEKRAPANEQDLTVAHKFCTVLSSGFGPCGLCMHSFISNRCLVAVRFAIAVWQKTPIAFTCSWG